jgi:hypothetical protein
MDEDEEVEVDVEAVLESRSKVDFMEACDDFR